ncbi:aminotransferase class I/II-fold pyridoxal phosphate-dependent enzyme [Phaeacidiphilus oryzae]|uniref:aminotransferase class I/II-fold pyridoxal phosphate-dependent enzyme n=1 Tax=Phaeacidiphilus oryzae TaxID=348818 RepID=UPI00056AE479|nr:ornithine decarboxylase [Phaeacidiphilus oryzae]
MDHSRAPVLEALEAYRRCGRTPFSPPGHKQGRGADPRVRKAIGDAVFASDVLAFSGLDDRVSSHGILEEAQELMADAVGAKHAFFSTCGSSLSVKSAMLAVARPHEYLLIGRDVHKSVVSGLILSGIRPVWVEPRWDRELRLAHPPGPAEFEEAFERCPEARGALVTSPSPYGACADLEKLVEVCHRRGKPLLVDEAWGAHLPFHPSLPRWAMDAGADVCVTSVHKMGTGLEQGSVFHLQGDLISPVELKQCADLLGTTSPSVLIYAALDGWRRQMVEDGKELLRRTLALTEEVRGRIEQIDGLHVLGSEFTAPGMAAEFDPLPTVIDVSGLGVTGYRVADWLYEREKINVHLADHRRINTQLTIADDDSTADQLYTALSRVADHAAELRPAETVEIPPPEELRLEQVLLPRDAFFGRTERVAVEDAAGRIVAEMLTPYPPGIPVALPGERLNRPVLRYLASGLRAGMVVPDAADPELGSVRVAVED